MDAPTASRTPPASRPFAPDALRLLAEARQESDRLRNEFIGIEHLVLAMARHPRPAAASILAACGVDPHRVQQSFAELLGSGDATVPPNVALPYTTRTQRVFELASDTAGELGHAQVEVVDLLVGIMREGMGVGAQVLRQNGLTAEAAYDGARATPRSSP